MMKQIKTHSFLWAVFAGFLGAGLFVWLFHGIPVTAQDDRMVVKAHQFVVLNDNNEPVGVLASTTGPGGPGLPYLSLEGMHGEGKIFIGIFKPGNPQVRLQGENGRGGAGFSVFEGSAVFSLRGKEDEVIQIVPNHNKAWNQMLEQFKASK
jgi:hypothetical protein